MVLVMEGIKRWRIVGILGRKVWGIGRVIERWRLVDRFFGSFGFKSFFGLFFGMVDFFVVFFVVS